MSSPGTARLRLYRNSTFRWFWSGQLVSTLGDQFFPITVVAMVLTASGEPALSLSLVLGARFAAMAIFILIGGVLADRFDRFRLMIGTDVVRALAIIPILVTGAESPLWLIVTVTFVLGAGGALFQPTYDASINSIVAPELVAKANAASKVLRNAGGVVGPALAAAMVTFLGPRVTLAIDLATFIASIVTLLVLAKREHRSPHDRDSAAQVPMWRAALEGVRLVMRMRWLATLELMALLQVLLAVAPWMVLLPLVFKDGPGGLQTYGIALSAFAVGGLIGAVVAAHVRLRKPGIAFLAGFLPFGVCCGGLALSQSLPLVVALSVLAGFGTEFADVLKMTAIQRQIPQEFLGRVFALDFFASLVPMPLGQLLAGALVAPGQETQALLLVSVVILSTTMLPLLVRGVSTLGAEADASPVRGST